MNNKITIHKDNNLVKYEPFKHLSSESFKILDYLYYKTQKYLNNETIIKTKEKKKRKLVLYKEHHIEITQTELKEGIGINSNDYHNVIRKALKELSQPVELYNYEEEGEFILWGLKSFITDAKHKIDKYDKKTKIFSMALDPKLFNIIINLRGEYVKIDLEYQKEWRSTNTIRLYQYLKSIQRMKSNPKHHLEDLNKFFKVKKPLIFGRMRDLINRNLKIIKEDTDIDVELEDDKKTKTYSFNIKNKKGVKTLAEEKKQQYAIQKNEEENLAITNVLEKFKDKD